MWESNTARRRTWCLSSRESKITFKSPLSKTTPLCQRRDTMIIPLMMTLKSTIVVKSSRKSLVIASLLKMKSKFKQKESLNWKNTSISTTYNNLLFNQSKRVKLNHPNNFKVNLIDNQTSLSNRICLMISNNYWVVKSIGSVLNHYSRCSSYTASTNKSSPK